jgi:hypothetical protein
MVCYKVTGIQLQAIAKTFAGSAITFEKHTL